MASAPVDVLPVEGGFVATAEVVGAEAAPAADVAVAAAPAARPMRWNNNTSGFVLRRMSQLLSDDTRLDKVFKDKDFNLVAKCLKDYSGDAMRPTQVYNHLRKWRQKWFRICKLKDLSGALWDKDVNAIMLDGITTYAIAR
jgi:predicted metal-dependent peptidase